MITNFGPCNMLFIGGIGPTEMLLIFGALLLLFGADKLPQLARSMGTSMGEFKKAQKESEESLKNYESSIKNSVKNEEIEQNSSENKINVNKIATDLGISTENKTDDQIRDEINDKLK